MSDVKIEVVRTRGGKYKMRVTGDDGPPIARVRRGAMGIKTTPAQREADARAVQAGLKFLYERQQAEAAQGA